MHKGGGEGEHSSEIRARVNRARAFAASRFGTESDHFFNAALSPAEVRTHCVLDGEATDLLRGAFERLGLTARGHDRVLRVARTIADLAESSVIRKEHLAEAISYRSLDRKYWNR